LIGEFAGRKTLLSVENLTLPREGHGLALDDVSLSLNQGEILAIYGLMGAGRTELFECLMGLHPEARGTIKLNDQPLRNQTIGQRIAKGITLVPEDRQRLGLVQLLSVKDNITLASLERYRQQFWLSKRQERDSTRGMIQDLAIKTRSADSPVNRLAVETNRKSSWQNAF
jgi:erythritol transport system ATP-binding protein